MSRSSGPEPFYVSFILIVSSYAVAYELAYCLAFTWLANITNLLNILITCSQLITIRIFLMMQRKLTQHRTGILPRILHVCVLTFAHDLSLDTIKYR